MKKFIAAIAVSGFAVIMMFVGVFAIKTDKKVDVKHIASVVHEGYAPTQEYYIVEASPNKMWQDTGAGLVILAFILAAASGLAIVLSDYSPESPHSFRTGFIILSFWAGALVCGFGSYTAKEGDSSYTTKLCPDQYQANQSNLDALFPAVDEPLNCN